MPCMHRITCKGLIPMLVGSVNNRKSRQSRASGFTLVEVLVVMAIMGVLAAILFPALTKAKEAARISECLSNIHQVGLGLNLYMDQYDSHFPPAAPWGIPGAPDSDGRTIQELLSSYVQNGLVRDASTGLYTSGGVFACPSDYGIPRQDQNGNPFDVLNGVPANNVVWKHTGCSYEYYASDQEDWLHWELDAPRVPWTGLSPQVQQGSEHRRIGAPLSSVVHQSRKAVLGDIWFWHMGDEVPVCRVANRNTLFADGRVARLDGAHHLESRLQPLQAGWHKYSPAR